MVDQSDWEMNGENMNINLISEHCYRLAWLVY